MATSHVGAALPPGDPASLDITAWVNILQQLKKNATTDDLVLLHRALLPTMDMSRESSPVRFTNERQSEADKIASMPTANIPCDSDVWKRPKNSPRSTRARNSLDGQPPRLIAELEGSETPAQSPAGRSENGWEMDHSFQSRYQGPAQELETPANTTENPLAGIDASRLAGPGADAFFELPAGDVLSIPLSPDRERSATPEIRITHPSQEHESPRTPVGHHRHMIARRSFDEERPVPEVSPLIQRSNPKMGLYQQESSSNPFLPLMMQEQELTAEPDNSDPIYEKPAQTPPDRLRTPVLDEDSFYSNASAATVIHHEEHAASSAAPEDDAPRSEMTPQSNHGHAAHSPPPSYQPQPVQSQLDPVEMASAAVQVFSGASSVYEDDCSNGRIGRSHSQKLSKADSGYESESSYQAARARFETASASAQQLNRPVPSKDRVEYKVGTVTSINMRQESAAEKEPDVQPILSLRTMLRNSPIRADSQIRPRQPNSWSLSGRPNSKVFGNSTSMVKNSAEVIDEDDVFVDHPEEPKQTPRKLQKRRPMSGNFSDVAALGVPPVPTDLALRHLQRMKKQPAMENLRRAQILFTNTQKPHDEEPVPSPAPVPIHFPSPFGSPSKTPSVSVRLEMEAQQTLTRTPLQHLRKDTSFLISPGQTPVEEEKIEAKQLGKAELPRKSPSFFRGFSRKSTPKKRRSDVKVEEEEEETVSNLADFDNVREMLGASTYDVAAATFGGMGSSSKHSPRAAKDMTRLKARFGSDQAAVEFARRKSRDLHIQHEEQAKREQEKQEGLLPECEPDTGSGLDNPRSEVADAPALPTRSPARPKSFYGNSLIFADLEHTKGDSASPTKPLREQAITEMDEPSTEIRSSWQTNSAEHDQAAHLPIPPRRLERTSQERISVHDWADETPVESRTGTVPEPAMPSEVTYPASSNDVFSTPTGTETSRHPVAAEEQEVQSKPSSEPAVESGWESWAKLWRDRRKGAGMLKFSDTNAKSETQTPASGQPTAESTIEFTPKPNPLSYHPTAPLSDANLSRERLDADLPPVPDEASSAALFSRRKSVAEGHLRRPHKADLTRKESLEEFGVSFMQRRQSIREGKQARNPLLMRPIAGGGVVAGDGVVRGQSPVRADVEQQEQQRQQDALLMPRPSLPTLSNSTGLPPASSPLRPALPWSTSPPISPQPSTSTSLPGPSHATTTTTTTPQTAFPTSKPTPRRSSPLSPRILKPLFKTPHKRSPRASISTFSNTTISTSTIPTTLTTISNSTSPDRPQPRVSISPSPSVRERARIFEEAAEALVKASYVQRPAARRGVRSAHAPRREAGKGKGVGLSLKSPRAEWSPRGSAWGVGGSGGGAAVDIGRGEAGWR